MDLWYAHALPALGTAAVADPWYERALSALGTAAALVAGLAAAYVLFAAGRSWYQRTLGRRRDRYRRLARLGTGAQLSFFTAVLGEPPAMRRSFSAPVHVLVEGTDQFATEARLFWECIYVDRDYYVQVAADADKTVLAFSVTTRSKRFRPRLTSPGRMHVEPGRMRRALRLGARYEPMFDVRLASSRLSSIGLPNAVEAWQGAHNRHYHEVHYLGNPGHYQHYAFGISDAGAGGWDAEMVGVLFPRDAGLWELQWPSEPEHDETNVDVEGEEFDGDVWAKALADAPDPTEEDVFRDAPGVIEFRRRTRFNTYTVIGPSLLLGDYPLTFGPSDERVRTLG